VSDALPYVNAVLCGNSYSKDPPSVGFKINGKLITIHSRKIAVNALKDEEETTKKGEAGETITIFYGSKIVRNETFLLGGDGSYIIPTVCFYMFIYEKVNFF